MLTREDLADFGQTQADFLNVRYFDGILKYTITVAPKENRKWFARCCGAKSQHNTLGTGAIEIQLNPVLCFAYIAELEEIIAHELIHVVQLDLKVKPGHGPDFRQLARRFGIPVESSMACASANVRTSLEMHTGAPPRNRLIEKNEE